MSKNTIFKFLLSKKIYIFFIMIFIGVLLLTFGGKEKKSDKNNDVSIDSLDPAEYASLIEEQVESLCNRIDGVSGTYAVVTLKGGFQAIYATDEQKTSSGNKNQTVIIGSGSAEQALLSGYRYPEIAGIGIVCNGGNSYDIKNKIVTLIASTFNISANKIFVVGS